MQEQIRWLGMKWLSFPPSFDDATIIPILLLHNPPPNTTQSFNCAAAWQVLAHIKTPTSYYFVCAKRKGAETKTEITHTRFVFSASTKEKWWNNNYHCVRADLAVSIAARVSIHKRCVYNYAYRCEPAIFRATMRLITPNFCFPCERSIHLSLLGLYAAAAAARFVAARWKSRCQPLVTQNLTRPLSSTGPPLTLS